MQLLAKFQKILYMGFRATLNFRKFIGNPGDNDYLGYFSLLILVVNRYITGTLSNVVVLCVQWIVSIS